MESNILYCGRLIDYILLVVEDFEVSKNFYIVVLLVLEILVIIIVNEYLLVDELVVVLCYSLEVVGKLIGCYYLVFQVRDCDMVDVFYYVVLIYCGCDNGVSGE